MTYKPYKMGKPTLLKMVSPAKDNPHETTTKHLPHKKKSDANELVKHTDTNKPAKYGGSNTSSYETVVSKGTANLIKHGAPADVIAKAKANDLANFKKSQNNKQNES